MNNDTQSASPTSTPAGARLSRRTLLKLAGAGLLLWAAPGGFPRPASGAPAKTNVVVRWNEALLEAVRATKMAPPITARALAITHTATYDAWAPYTKRATPTRPGPRRPKGERRLANKSEAISHAAYRALVDLFPTQKVSFDGLMKGLGYNPANTSVYGLSPSAIGNSAARKVLDARCEDGSNQTNGYADTADYRPVNQPLDPSRPFTPADGFDPDRWQPLLVPDGQGGHTLQKFLVPHWGEVRPFGLSSGEELRSVVDGSLQRWADRGDGRSHYVEQFREVLRISAGLDERQKAIAEYWADGPGSETPPGHWNVIAHYVSRRDRHTLDEDVKLYFALNNALMDAGIASWACKRHYDSIRPISAIRFLYAGRMVRAWGGPGKGTQRIDGGTWLPYQKADFLTPPFAEFVSGHSTFSRAASVVLRAFTGSDRYGESHTQEAGTSLIEPGVPSAPVTLSWKTFTEAAQEAGISRLYGGIHIMDGNTGGLKLGEEVGKRAWRKARSHFNGA
jgi:uncharacterized protein DUF6851/vanadium-dependent haloperoxidase-like protein